MATKKKMVPVTSVTPASKVKAVSKAQQARTRNLVMGIASATPVGRVARGAATAGKAAKAEVIMAKAGWNKAAKQGYRADVKRGTYDTPKSTVRVKPAAKTVGNPPNETKAWEDYIGSVSRGAPASGRSAGKSKTARVFNSKVAKKTVRPVKEPARTPTPDNRPPYSYKTIEINSAVKSKTADQARSSSNATRKVTPSRVPVKPAARRVMINSGKSGKPVVKRLAVKSAKKK